MKPSGCSIIFVNRFNQILLVLRDDNPAIACPGMWDLPGGHVEIGETPLECIRREMAEEIGLDIGEVALYGEFEFPDRIETVFKKSMDFRINDITLTEGQRIQWFSAGDLQGKTLAFGFNRVVDLFFLQMENGSVTDIFANLSP